MTHQDQQDASSPPTDGQPRETLAEVYFNWRMAALLAIGFGAGLPSIYKLLNSTLQAWLISVDETIDVTKLGLITLLALPIAWNFLWAPLLDRYRPPLTYKRFGHRRGWLILIQIALGLAVMVMGLVGPRETPLVLGPLIAAGLLVGFLVAVQDVVADAYRTDVLTDEELGAGAGVFVNGYRAGMWVAGGGALLAAPIIGWPFTYVALGACMLLAVVGTIIGPVPPGDDVKPTTLFDAAVEPFVDLYHRFGWRCLVALAFIILFKLPDQLANAMIMPLLQKHMTYDVQTISLIRESYGLLITVLGTFAGGVLIARIGVVRSLYVYGLLQAVSNLGFVVLAMSKTDAPPSMTLLTAVVTVENFSAGLVTAGFVAFLMSLCNRAHSATQYALFTSLMAGSGIITGALSGIAVEKIGYATFFLLTALIGLPGLALIAYLPRGRRPIGDV